MLKRIILTLLSGLALVAGCGEVPAQTVAPEITTATPTAPISSPAPLPAATLAPLVSRTVIATASRTIEAAVKPAFDASEPVRLRFSEFYAGSGAGPDLQLSDKLKSVDGRRVQIVGYMAPPLKPDLDFFVLTRIRLVTCPFCSTSEEWPQDIILVTLPAGKTVQQIEEPLNLVGRLEIGEKVDPQTGFLSLLRLRAETIEVFKGS